MLTRLSSVLKTMYHQLSSKSKRNYSVENREPILEMLSWLASFLSRQHNEQQGRMTVHMASIFCLGLVSLFLPVFWSVPEIHSWWL